MLELSRFILPEFYKMRTTMSGAVMPATCQPSLAGIQASEVKQTSLFTSISLTNRSRTLLTSFVLTRLDASLRWHDIAYFNFRA